MIASPTVVPLTASPGRVHDVLLRRSNQNAHLRLYLAAEDLIALLNQTLSLTIYGPLDLVTVLDWSAVAAGRTIDPGQERQARTPGELMERARRRSTHPRMGALAIWALVAEMARVIGDHPAYRDACVIMGGPDSLEDEPNLRTRIAAELAAATAKELVLLRWPVWQISGSAPLLSSLDQRLSGSVIVVDDVWTDGRTMNVVGQLARDSGADRVFGLAATIAHSTERHG